MDQQIDPNDGGRVDSFLDTIRRTGLIAGEAANSYEYDKALGRTEYVFLGTASFRFNYGFGFGILVDPSVLEKPGIEAFDQDIGHAVKCMEIWLQDSGCIGLTRDRVKRPDILREVVMEYRTQHGNPEEGAEWTMAVRIAGSVPFKRYYAEHYQVSVEGLYQAIQATAEKHRCSLLGYFSRTTIWPLMEEFLVPRRVEADYLLGYWNGGAWNEWSSPRSDETNDRRLRSWLDALRRGGKS